MGLSVPALSPATTCRASLHSAPDSPRHSLRPPGGPRGRGGLAGTQHVSTRRPSGQHLRCGALVSMREEAQDAGHAHVRVPAQCLKMCAWRLPPGEHRPQPDCLSDHTRLPGTHHQPQVLRSYVKSETCVEGAGPLFQSWVSHEGGPETRRAAAGHSRGTHRAWPWAVAQDHPHSSVSRRQMHTTQLGACEVEDGRPLLRGSDKGLQRAQGCIVNTNVR